MKVLAITLAVLLAIIAIWSKDKNKLLFKILINYNTIVLWGLK